MTTESTAESSTEVARYEPAAIERRWQQRWEADGLYRTPDHVEGRENRYALTMLPYTSGDLHVGHWFAIAPSDAIARFRRMQGYNVLFPMGFDAFGLPRRERGHRRRGAPRRLDGGEHRAHARTTEAHGRDVRLGARDEQLRARLLPLDAVVVPPAPEARPRVSRRGAGQLVPLLQHDAGQRAGRRRRLRAL